MESGGFGDRLDARRRGSSFFGYESWVHGGRQAVVTVLPKAWNLIVPEPGPKCMDPTMASTLSATSSVPPSIGLPTSQVHM
jgi:hypothetical protein